MIFFFSACRAGITSRAGESVSDRFAAQSLGAVNSVPVWLMHSDRAGYETLGRLWQWLKGISGKRGVMISPPDQNWYGCETSGIDQLRNLVPQHIEPTPPDEGLRHWRALPANNTKAIPPRQWIIHQVETVRTLSARPQHQPGPTIARS